MTIEGLIEKYKNTLPDEQITEEDFKLMMSNIGNLNANIREDNFDFIARLIISGKLEDYQMLQLLEHCEFVLRSVKVILNILCWIEVSVHLLSESLLNI